MLSRASLEKLKTDGARFNTVIPEPVVRSILNCAKKSNDIPGRHLLRIDEALKAMKKPTAAKMPPPRPTNVTVEVHALRLKFESTCATCRTHYLETLQIEETLLVAYLTGKSEPPARFGEDAQAGFELMPPCACRP